VVEVDKRRKEKKKERNKRKKEAKKLVSQRFYKKIHVYRKKASERMSTRKIYDHVFNVKKEILLRRRKVYLLLGEEREKVCKFVEELIEKKVY